MTKPKKRTVYKAISGKVYNTKQEAVLDNIAYNNNIHYRYNVKAENAAKHKELTIPFITAKRRVLTNAGLATGAVISENMLDSVAKYANAAGLPIKTALGLVTKESTLGNPTDDRSFNTLVSKRVRDYLDKEYGTDRYGQHINKDNDALNARTLVNYYKDIEYNPYYSSLDWARKRNNYFRELEMLKAGERYADEQEKKRKDIGNINVLEAAFRDYKNNPNNYNPAQRNYSQLVERRANEVWGSPEIQNWYKTYRKRSLEQGRNKKSNGGIHIAPSKRGTFTAAATKHGIGVQAFASKVLADKENYSPAMVKKANFARNASKWN